MFAIIEKISNIVMRWAAKLFPVSAGAVLTISGFAKLISAGGGARILQNTDPIFGMRFRYVFLFVATIELIIAGVCFFGKRPGIQNGSVAWISSSFLSYRIGLFMVGYHKPCQCLGNLTDALHVSPQAADTAMKIVLAYLLIGSYSSLFWLWRQGKKTTRPAIVQ